jgi:hypothetical protein
MRRRQSVAADSERSRGEKSHGGASRQSPPIPSR